MQNCHWNSTTINAHHGVFISCLEYPGYYFPLRALVPSLHNNILLDFTLETCWHLLFYFYPSSGWWMKSKWVTCRRYLAQSFSDEVLMRCGLVLIISRAAPSYWDQLQIKPACNQSNLCFLLQFYMTARFNRQFVGRAWLIVICCR